MNRETKIYKITNKITNKIYIGLTSMSLEQRWWHHCNNKTNKCPRLSNSINKHGKDNFTIEQIDIAYNTKDAEQLEIRYINEFNSLSPNGYNLTTGGSCSTFNDETKEKMSKSQINKWNNLNKEERTNFLKGVTKYVEDKKEPVVGVNIKTYEVISFPNITDLKNHGFNDHIHNNLKRIDVHSQGYMWFYKDDNLDYVEETKNYLQKVGYEGKKMSHKAWLDPENRADRLKKMINAAAYRAKPLIAVSRFDLSILEFPTVASSIKAGYEWGSVRNSLNKSNDHAYNYVWFYKDSNRTIESYKEEAKVILGDKFSSINVTPFVGINIETGHEISFNKLDDVTLPFSKKRIRSVLIGRVKSHLGYYWKFKQ